jgi:hypothetical protein
VMLQFHTVAVGELLSAWRRYCKRPPSLAVTVVYFV